MNDPEPAAAVPPTAAMPNAMTERDFYGCYDDSWKGLITPAAFAHPAKFAYGLLSRLYDHGFAQGWWKKGDVIGDPFGGVACGGIVAAYNGLSWRGVELEPKFVALAQENIALHRRRWEGLGDPVPEIIQGDSRQFAELVKASAIVTSPPFRDARSETAKSKPGKGGPCLERWHTVQAGSGYGDSPGQIDALPTGDLDAVLTSPPYSDAKGSPALGGWRRAGWGEGGDIAQRQGLTGRYGQTAGQIGQLKEGAIDAVVTSQPYSKQSHHGGNTPTAVGIGRKTRGQRKCEAAGQHNLTRTYGTTEGQIDETDGETYWQAVAAVYRSCHAALRPAGVLCCVVKDFVRDRARVPLCDQTMRLLESIGFVPVERIRCWLVKEKREAGLFGEDVVTKTEKKSFFRRLQESKGSPRIDFEEILVVRRGEM